MDSGAHMNAYVCVCVCVCVYARTCVRAYVCMREVERGKGREGRKRREERKSWWSHSWDSEVKPGPPLGVEPPLWAMVLHGQTAPCRSAREGPSISVNIVV